MILHHLYYGLSPILQLNNEEFINTVKGKNIKFTHVTEKQKSSKKNSLTRSILYQ